MSMKVHIDRFCVQIMPLPASYESISFINLEMHDPISSPFKHNESFQNVNPVHILHSQDGSSALPHGLLCQSLLSKFADKELFTCVSRHQIILKVWKLTNQVRMDHNSIRLIFTIIATLIHITGTSIYTLIHISGILNYTKNLIIRFLAFSSLLAGASQ